MLQATCVGRIDRWISSGCCLKAFFLQPQVGIVIHLERAARSQALAFLGDRMPAKGRAGRIIPRRPGAGRTQRSEILPKNQVIRGSAGIIRKSASWTSSWVADHGPERVRGPRASDDAAVLQSKRSIRNSIFVIPDRFLQGLSVGDDRASPRFMPGRRCRRRARRPGPTRSGAVLPTGGGTPAGTRTC
jgi:hypothetical protein